jgi:hypothetical protein
VADASKFVSLGEKRRVRVLSVDIKKNQINVSLLEPNVRRSSPRRTLPKALLIGSPQELKRRARAQSAGRGGRGMGGVEDGASEMGEGRSAGRDRRDDTNPGFRSAARGGRGMRKVEDVAGDTGVWRSVGRHRRENTNPEY